MAAFTENELLEYFGRIGRQYDLGNMPAYMNTVLADWREFNAGRQNEEYGQLPQRYTGVEFEYLIVYHFARYFLDGIQYDAAIRETFSNYPQVAQVNARLDDQRLFSLDMSRSPDYLTTDASADLRNAFITLGRALLNERFNLEDFLTV